MAAIEAVSELVSIYDADDRLIFRNRAFRDLHHNTPEAIALGTRFEDYAKAVLAKGLPLDAVGREEEWLRIRLERHRNPQGPFELPRTDGTYYLINEQRLPNGGIAVIGINIAELKRTQKALKESEERFREFAEVASDWFWEMGADFRFTFFSGRAWEVTGKDPSDVIGMSRLEITPENLTDEKWQNHLEDLKHHRPFRNFVYDVDAADGRRITVSTNGQPVFDQDGTFRGYRGTGTDVTKQRHADDTLRRSEELVRSFIEGSPDAVSTKDLDGRFTMMNQKCAELMGAPAEELLGKSADEIFPDRLQLIADVREQDSNVIGSGKAHDFEYEMPAKDGQRTYVASKFPVCDGEGNIIAIGTTSRDVTDRRQIESQLRQAQKMEAVGQLTGGIAHDFNNLLGVVVGNLELALGKSAAPDEQAGHIEKAIAAAERGARLTQSLLAFSRKQALRPSAIEAESLIDGMHDLLHRSLGEMVQVEAVCAPNLWLTEADPIQLENAILNLAINARDAMPDGGILTIEARNVSLDGQTAGQQQIEPGDYVMMAVSDNGVGIAPELLDRIFEPFYTTKDVGQGSGLGLSMVFGFARQSGGCVTCDSEAGKGTTFKLYLPRSNREAPVQSQAANTTRTETSSTGQVILVVEDDSHLLQLFKKMLESLGYKVLEAPTAQDALRIIADRKDIEVMLTDVVLPGGMSGPRLAEETRRLRPDLPTVFMSGYTEDRINQHGHLDETVRLLHKPFRKSDLAHALNEAMNGAIARPKTQSP